MALSDTHNQHPPKEQVVIDHFSMPSLTAPSNSWLCCSQDLMALSDTYNQRPPKEEVINDTFPY